MIQRSTRRPRRGRRTALTRIIRATNLEPLDRRILLAAPAEVTSWRNDTHNTGQNLAETVLTPTNVNATTFGLLSRATLDGQVYAQPLLKANVNAAFQYIITGGFLLLAASADALGRRRQST